MCREIKHDLKLNTFYASGSEYERQLLIFILPGEHYGMFSQLDLRDLDMSFVAVKVPNL